MANVVNPINIYFSTLEEASEWADAHPEVLLTIWGKTQSGKSYRGSFVLRKKAEQQSAEAVPAV